jgi:hypothetical protein
LTAIWEAAGSPWSVRLQALLPCGGPGPVATRGSPPPSASPLRTISPQQIDHRLAPVKRRLKTRRDGRTKPGRLGCIRESSPSFQSSFAMAMFLSLESAYQSGRLERSFHEGGRIDVP